MKLGAIHINSFRAAFEDVKFVFSNLPAVIGAAIVGAVNVVINAVNLMIDYTKGQINNLISMANAIPGVAIPQLDTTAPTVPPLRNQPAAELSRKLPEHNAAIESIMATDNFASSAQEVATSAGTAEDAVNKLNSALDASKTKKSAAEREAEKLAKSYERITRSAQQYVEAQKLEAQAIGMTEREANRLRYTQDLLNQAQDAGIKLTSAQKAELEGLASAMADAEANTTALRDAFDFAKEVTSGFLNDFKSGLEQGKGVLRSFADAALGALNKIADKLIEMAINSLWANAFGGASGAASSGGGGMFGSLFSGLSKMFGFSSGGWTGGGATSAAAGFVHGQEFVVRAGPAAQHRQLLEAINSGRPVNANNNQPVAANGNRALQINVNVSGARGNQEIMQMVESGVRQGIGEYDRNLAGRVNEIANDPRMVG